MKRLNFKQFSRRESKMSLFFTTVTCILVFIYGYAQEFHNSKVKLMKSYSDSNYWDHRYPGFVVCLDWPWAIVYKTKEREQYACRFLQFQILKEQNRINHGEYCYHVNYFTMESANSFCNFHILFRYYELCYPL